MSENRFDVNKLNERPAVLGGKRVVDLPAGMMVSGWSSSRWGVEPELSRRPRRGESVWPSWPQFSDASLDRAVALIQSQRDGGAGYPLGYLGQAEQALELRYARMIGADARGREPKVFAVRDGSLALVIGYLALLTKRYFVEGRPMAVPPNAVTSVRSFEATWTGLQKAGLRPVFADVDPETGCPTAHELASKCNPHTVLLSVPLLYDRSPDIHACRQLADHLGIGLVIDAAHAHMARWRGHHVAKWADIYTVSGQGSKIVTPGSEYGFVVAFDPMLAALVAQIRNVGRGLSPKPAWWPESVPVTAGENGRNSELNAVLMGGSFDSYEELAVHRQASLARLQVDLANSRGPWRMLPPQPQLGGVMYKATLVWDPRHSQTPGDWEQVGWRAAGRMLAEELVTEVAASYPPPWERASEYHPGSRPWAWDKLIPDVRPQQFTNASYLAAHAHELPHEFLARPAAAAQTLTAVEKLQRWVSHREVQVWAQRHNA